MKGIDCNVKLIAKTAAEVKAAGNDFVVRYVGRLQQATQDIDKAEKDIILNAGLMLGLVQHCPGSPGIIPTKETAITYGKNAVLFAQRAEYKEGCILYLDLENIDPAYRARKQDIYDYENYWYDNVYKTYTPGNYIGFNTWMTNSELYHKFRAQHYWKSLSDVPDVAERGYEMIQSEGDKSLGFSFDQNVVIGDREGNKPIFMLPTMDSIK